MNLTVPRSNDLRYPICIAAALKAGYIPMLTSPRNSVEGQESLLRSTRCHKIIYSSEVESQIKEIKSVFPEVNVFEVPTLADLVHPESEPLHYSGRQSSEENAACLVLHTSGSTGMFTRRRKNNTNCFQEYRSRFTSELVVLLYLIHWQLCNQKMDTNMRTQYSVKTEDLCLLLCLSSTEWVSYVSCDQSRAKEPSFDSRVRE